MAVIGAKGVVVHIDKIERVNLIHRKISHRRHLNETNCGGGKKLECARFHDKHVCDDPAQ
jgi:hypothetical protein